MKNFLIKYKIILIILVLIAEGLFLRLYNLEDWLHFQLDQSRDAYLIKDIVEKGASELPLLGPRAGGSFLRLGPAYYYMMYLFSLISGSFHPLVFVLPEIIGSIVFVPLFYLLAKRFFDWKWSLIVTALAVNSTFLVTYDRFSWNPNLLPLFSLLTIHAWLKYFDAKKKKDEKSAFLWVALTALSVGIFVQMHFVAFTAIPIILALSALAFWLRSRLADKKLAENYTKNIIKEIAVFLLIFLFVQTPMLVNEYIGKGINTKQFFSTIVEKQDKDTSHTTAEKLIQNLWVYPKGYFVATTGSQGIDFPIWQTQPNFDILCDDKCRKSFAPTFLAALIFLLAGAVFLYLIIKRTKEITVKNNSSRNYLKNVTEWEFLILIAIWILVPWWAFFSLSFTLRPRFFLISIVPLWIITGLFLRHISDSKIGEKIAVTLASLILISNIVNIVVRFDRSASASQVDTEDYPQDQILFQDESYPVVLKQQQAIADWIKEKYQTENPSKDYIFLWAPSFYYRPIMYLIDNTELEGKARYFSNYPVWINGSYYAITRATDPADFFRKEKPEMFEVVEQQTFGTLAVYKLKLTEKGLIEAKKRETKFKEGEKLSSPERTKKNCLKKPKPTCRYTWGDVF